MQPQNDNSNDGYREVRGRRQQQPIRHNRQDVLQRVAQGDIKPEEADRMLRTRLPPRFVVTRTGAIALYNLKRDPIVLYADQWEKLGSLIERNILKTFMSRNESIIKRRPRPQQQSEQQSEEQQSEQQSEQPSEQQSEQPSEPVDESVENEKDQKERD